MSFAGLNIPPQIETVNIAEAAVDISRLEALTTLLARSDRVVRRRFLDLVNGAAAIRSLEEIATLLERGQIFEAIRVTDQIAPSLSVALDEAFIASGRSAAATIRSSRATLIDFNTLNDRAVNALQRNRLRLVRELSASQQQATFELVNDALARGLAPVEQARALKQSIGLTGKQAQAVTNFRQLLEARSSQSLSRELRDRRFDPTIRRAIREGVDLTPVQIDRMVARYSERFVQFRANTIARTESLRAINEGEQEMWDQAIEQGVITPDEIDSVWRTVGDERVRGSHAAMNRQKRPFGEPFVSGAGNQLRFPGDPNAPSSETVNCRCVVARELRSRRRITRV